MGCTVADMSIGKLRIAFATAAALTVFSGAVFSGTATAATSAGKSRAPVLGSKKFEAPGGVGWGTVKPKEIFNGGDPSGLVTNIKWTGWGEKKAYGWGRNAIFKPGGGYYPQLVRIELRAQQLGSCSKGGRPAYTHLYAREPSKPGGKLGRWYSWGYNGHNICTPYRF